MLLLSQPHQLRSIHGLKLPGTQFASFEQVLAPLGELGCGLGGALYWSRSHDGQNLQHTSKP